MTFEGWLQLNVNKSVFYYLTISQTCSSFSNHTCLTMWQRCFLPYLWGFGVSKNVCSLQFVFSNHVHHLVGADELSLKTTVTHSVFKEPIHPYHKCHKPFVYWGAEICHFCHHTGIIELNGDQSTEKSDVWVYPLQWRCFWSSGRGGRLVSSTSGIWSTLRRNNRSCSFGQSMRPCAPTASWTASLRCLCAHEILICSIILF